MYETEDLYEILQLHPSAHPDVIQAAYRRLSFLYHPDRNPSTEATEMMKRLNHAYEILSDPDRRAAYDRTRSAQPLQRSGSDQRTSYDPTRGAQQGQRAGTGSRDAHRERPSTSRPTSQSGAARERPSTSRPTSQSGATTPAAPPETRYVDGIMKSVVGIAVVGAVLGAFFISAESGVIAMVTVILGVGMFYALKMHSWE